jgi:hypothetical protein
VPEASVIRDPQALSGFIGRKEFVGGLKSFLLKTEAQPQECKKNWQTRGR